MPSANAAPSGGGWLRGSAPPATVSGAAGGGGGPSAAVAATANVVTFVFFCIFVIGVYPGPDVGPGMRLRIINGCETEPLWIANQGYKSAYLEPQMAKLNPGEAVGYRIPGEGLVSTRFWPLARCNDDGTCEIGQSFEATWGCPVGLRKTLAHTSDSFDVSLVDGLDYMRDCPHDNLGSGREDVDLRVINPQTQNVVGCTSPCGRLTFPNWQKIPYRFQPGG
eukprot:gene30658-37287_t